MLMLPGPRSTVECWPIEHRNVEIFWCASLLLNAIMLHDCILTTMKHIKRFSTFLCSMVNIQERHPSKHNRILLNFTECIQHIISEALNKKNPGSIEMTRVGLHYHTFPFEQLRHRSTPIFPLLFYVIRDIALHPPLDLVITINTHKCCSCHKHLQLYKKRR